MTVAVCDDCGAPNDTFVNDTCRECGAELVRHA